MNINSKNPIAHELADILTDIENGWDSLYDWYGEVCDMDIADHYTIAELRAVGVEYSDDELITALNVVRNAVERNIREDEEQDRWENLYWLERDVKW